LKFNRASFDVEPTLIQKNGRGQLSESAVVPPQKAAGSNQSLTGSAARLIELLLMAGTACSPNSPIAAFGQQRDHTKVSYQARRELVLTATSCPLEATDDCRVEIGCGSSALGF
jgi:hypothetical protein